MARHGDAGGAIGELALVLGSGDSASSPTEAKTERPAADQLLPQPEPAPLRSAVELPRRRPRRAEVARVRVDLQLPADLTTRAKELTRPQRTGAPRTIGAAFLLQAQLVALDELPLEIDTSGLDADDHELAVARVLDALHVWAGAARES